MIGKMRQQYLFFSIEPGIKKPKDKTKLSPF
jgi:hypothetical protein